MTRQLLFIPLLASLVLGAEELPNPQLLPTTKAIREIILAKQKEEAAKLEAYTQDIPLAEGSKIDLIPIPAGKFKIGSDPASPKHMPDEAPQKEIAIQPFWMAKLETTWDIYRPYMENAKARNKDGTLNRDADMSMSIPMRTSAWLTPATNINEAAEPNRSFLMFFIVDFPYFY